MTDGEGEVLLDSEQADLLWQDWAPAGPERVLAQAAFERVLRDAAGLQDDGLYFRPGGWRVDLAATAVRVAIAAGVLAVGFQMTGQEDLDREVVIAAAALVSGMEVSRARLGQLDERLLDRLRGQHLDGEALTADQARRALPRKARREVAEEEVTVALDRLVEAGMADKTRDGEWVVRAAGSEAWLRLRLR